MLPGTATCNVGLWPSPSSEGSALPHQVPEGAVADSFGSGPVDQGVEPPIGHQQDVVGYPGRPVVRGGSELVAVHRRAQGDLGDARLEARDDLVEGLSAAD